MNTCGRERTEAGWGKGSELPPGHNGKPQLTSCESLEPQEPFGIVPSWDEKAGPSSSPIISYLVCRLCRRETLGKRVTATEANLEVADKVGRNQMIVSLQKVQKDYAKFGYRPC